MFEFLKKKKEDKEKMTQDEKELDKAKNDVEESKSAEQSKKDREDESVAAQEAESGNEDSQTAKDREDESVATEKENEQHAEEMPQWASAIIEEMKQMKEMLLQTKTTETLQSEELPAPQELSETESDGEDDNEDFFK